MPWSPFHQKNSLRRWGGLEIIIVWESLWRLSKFVLICIQVTDGLSEARVPRDWNKEPQWIIFHEIEKVLWTGRYLALQMFVCWTLIIISWKTRAWSSNLVVHKLAASCFNKLQVCKWQVATRLILTDLLPLDEIDKFVEKPIKLTGNEQ